MAEYYFDYQMRITENGLNLSKEELPVLHIERNYKNSAAIENIMYLTFPQWDPKPEYQGEEPDSLVKEIVIVYDICGVEISLVNSTYRDFVKNNFKQVAYKGENKSAEIKEKIGFSDYRRKGYRYVFSNGGGNDFSGVGKIVLRGKDEFTTEMYCMVNFGLKKKIGYTIKGNKVTFDKVDLDKLPPLRISYEANNYPCLHKSRRVTPHYEVGLGSEAYYPGETYELRKECEDNRVYIGLANPEDEKYFLLECRSNDMVLTHRERETVHVKQLFCPYCHGEIGIPDKNFMKLYKKGGVSCQGFRLMAQSGGKPVVIESAGAQGKPAKNVLYCAQDFTQEDGKLLFKDNEAPRLLPDDFLAHDQFKVLVVGSKRSGKTTFLSRLFNIVGKSNIDISGTLLSNATAGKDGTMDLESYNIKSIAFDMDANDKITCFKVGDPWCKENNSAVRGHFSDYSIDIACCHFPGATNSATKDNKGNKDYTALIRMPFVLEANGDSYVYFYDMAGEDAQQRTSIMASLAGTGKRGQAPVGIFYLIDKDANTDEIESVEKRLLEMAQGREVPLYVAIILTKFDKVEADFDTNCHCLRSDVYDMLASSYEDSAVITNIDLASEEIRAYLSAHNIMPTKLEKAAQTGNIVIKYFGVASFSATDAIYHEDEDTRRKKAEVNYVRHDCSPKRMELPVLWMLHQFKCIY